MSMLAALVAVPVFSRTIGAIMSSGAEEARGELLARLFSLLSLVRGGTLATSTCAMLLVLLLVVLLLPPWC